MIPIIDAGHGSNTPGKRSEGFYKNGKVLLKENSVNEAVCNKLSFLFWNNLKKAYFISNEWNDISLQERCNREIEVSKGIRRLGKKPFFLSIHADAFHVKNKAKGGRFFYFSNSGKNLAYQLTAYLRANGYQLNLREPKKANFKVLRDTSSPAVLFEMGFMTTESDLKLLLNDDFRNKTALLLYKAIVNL